MYVKGCSVEVTLVSQLLCYNVGLFIEHVICMICGFDIDTVERIVLPTLMGQV